MKRDKLQRKPILIPQLNNIKPLATGGNHVQALDHKGSVCIWGTGGQFQLGREVLEKYQLNALTPTLFGLPCNKIRYVACDSYHNFAVDNKDRVYAWSLSNYGQTRIAKGAGEGNAVIRRPKISDIQVGNYHSIACTEDGSLLTWGRCDDAQAGLPIEDIPDGDMIFDDRGEPHILIKPTLVPGVSAVSVTAGIGNSIALTKKGEAYSWGFSANFRTGQGTEDVIKEVTMIENSAVKGKKLTFADCGGQFSVLAGPAQGQ